MYNSQDQANNNHPSPGISRQNVSDNFSGKLFIIMIGLPLRGKSFISHKVERFLSWLGFHTKVFDVKSEIRRSIKGDQVKNVEENAEIRKECSFAVLNESIEFLKNSGQVAIYDATNCSQSRRSEVKATIENSLNDFDFDIVWIESVCNNKTVAEKVFQENLSKSDEFDKMSKNDAKRILLRKFTYYEDLYETFDDDESSYIKIFDFQKMISNRIGGYLQAKILYFLSNLNLVRKSIYFTRHGESQYNVLDKVGGDSPLSPKGRNYAKEIHLFVKNLPNCSKIKIFCSTLKRSIETVELANLKDFTKPPIKWSALNEIETGICDGMSYGQIKSQMPVEYLKRDADKLNYRYPNGESYKDLIVRLEPIILELERSKTPILVVGHRAILRCLYGYFCNTDLEEIPHIEMPLHHVIKLEPMAFGCGETRYDFNEGVSNVKLSTVWRFVPE